MTRKQLRRNNRISMTITVILAVILVAHMIITTVRGNMMTEAGDDLHPTYSEEVFIEEEFVEQEKPIESTEQEKTPSRYDVFDSMSADWGSDDVEGFVLYELPEEYAKRGYFPEKMQVYTYCLCKHYDVPYALVIAMIEHESAYVFDATGDGGESKGYMQIYEKFHTDRMERLAVDDLMNPYQNVRVGIDYIAELIEKYGTIQDALAAYNYGEKGARENLWNKGIWVYSYNQSIMNRMQEIEEELAQ